MGPARLHCPARGLRVATLVSAALLWGGVAAAATLQLTDHSDPACAVFAPAPSADGMVVAFESTCDLVGSNSDGNREIFLVDDLGTVTQLTDSLGCVNANPTIDADGDAIAFDSDCDLTGDNADGNVEIFHWSNAGIVQLTTTSSCDNLAPAINAAGDKVAFDSNCDHLPSNNVDGSNEIFRVVVGGGILQVTDDRSINGCGSFEPSIDDSGEIITFESDCNITGGNEDGVSEIFQATVGAGIVRLTVAPDDACASVNASSSADGTVVVFESDCDFTGANSDTSVEIFRVTSSGVVTQLSNDSGESLCESMDPSVSEDGIGAAWTSDCDPLGDNADASLEIFRARGTVVEQVTMGTNCQSATPRVRSSGNLLVYVSACDALGTNVDGSIEVFLRTDPCACGAPVTRFAGGSLPTATDALFILRTAVGTGICALCDCDVNSDTKVTATDALTVLKKAVDQDVTLTCP